MNVSFKGWLAVTDQTAANSLIKSARKTDGLYRFLIAGDKLLMCRGNEVVAVSPLSLPVFQVKVENLTPSSE